MKLLRRIKQANPATILFTSVAFSIIAFLVIEYVPSLSVFLIVLAVLLMFDN